MNDRRSFATFLMFGGAAALAVGAFLPWMKATAPLAGTVTMSGVDNGGDGIVMVVVAGAIGAFGWWLTRGARWWIAVVALIAATIAALVLAYDVHDLSTRFADARGVSDLVSTQYGAGLYLCGLGIAVAFVGAFVAMFDAA